LTLFKKDQIFLSHVTNRFSFQRGSEVPSATDSHHLVDYDPGVTPFQCSFLISGQQHRKNYQQRGPYQVIELVGLVLIRWSWLLAYSNMMKSESRTLSC